MFGKRRHPAFGFTLLVVSVVVLAYDALSGHSLNWVQVGTLVGLAVVGAVLVGLDVRRRPGTRS